MLARAMVVDDSDAFRAAFRDFVRAHDIDVVAEASSGEEAIRLATLVEPDIVFMDARMPGIGGVEACRRIRSAHPGLPLILISAGIEEVRRRPDGIGATPFLSKHEALQPGRLRRLVEQLVGPKVG